MKLSAASCGESSILNRKRTIPFCSLTPQQAAGNALASGFKSRSGFALVTAILAILILLALGYLAISVTTGDLKITSRVVGEKKALSAAETGIHRMIQNFDPANMPGTLASNVQVDAAADPASRYSVTNVGVPASGPSSLPLKGYSIGGGQQWGQRRYQGSVTGVNTNYGSSVQIDVGMGYGPIEITTMSR